MNLMFSLKKFYIYCMYTDVNHEIILTRTKYMIMSMIIA